MRRALVTIAAVTIWTGGGLGLERHVDTTGQLALGLLTACVLVGLLALQPAAVRAQTMLVVAVATCAEVVGSLLWGLYTYRLENLPAFVPPGHGLVFLGGVAVSQVVGRRHAWLVAGAVVGVVAWGVLGLTALAQRDVAGAIGCAVLAVVLVRTRTPVYAGVFVVVAALELYGTALGTWRWDAIVPGLGLPQGNPPSGVASGYVLFDVAALALLRWTAPLGARLGRLGCTVRLRARSLTA